MKLLRSPFDRHAYGAARRNAIVWRVVAGQHLKLGQSILRWHDGTLAAAAPVVCLAAIDEPNIVRLVQSVKADRKARTNRGRDVHIRQIGAHAQSESRKSDHVPAIRCEFGDL